MFAIVTKYVAEHKLNKDMSNKELSQHTPALLELLTDKLKRFKGRQRFQCGYRFSKEQVFLMIPDQRVRRCKSQETPSPASQIRSLDQDLRDVSSKIIQNPSIKKDFITPPRSFLDEGEHETSRETAQRIMRNSLNERDVKAIANAIAKTASSPVAGTSSLTRLRRKLRKLNAPEAIIEATKIPDMTKQSNKIQKERSEQRKDEGIDFPDHFSLESVKKRLDKYNITNKPDRQALADVMIN